MHKNNIAINISNVSKSYKVYSSKFHHALDSLGLSQFTRNSANEFIHALKDINLMIKRGERIGIIGRNGSGKSTLLKLMTKNYQPTLGTVQVHGGVQSLMDAGLGFNTELSGIDNVKNSLIYNGLSNDEKMQAIEDILEFAELGEFINFPLKTYSLGMASRLAFGTATAIKPEILLVDEVLGAGDGYFSFKSVDRIKKLTQKGTTLILVSHSNSQITQFCERVVWLDSGQIVADGPALEVVKEYDKFIRELDEKRLSDENRKRVLGAVQAKNIPSKEAKKKKNTALFSLKKTKPNVSRWPGLNELKIKSIRLLDNQKNEQTIFRQNSESSFEISITSTQHGVFECQYHVKIFTASGFPVSLYLSEKDNLDFSKSLEPKVAELKISNLMLGDGDYVITVGIYKSFDLKEPNNSVRYDLLDRSFLFKVVGQYSFNDCITQIPGIWYAEGKSIKDIISTSSP